jgi:uncharacterized cupin superfamily protein
MTIAAPAVAHGTYRREEFAEELAVATENTTVGHDVLFENDRVRIWALDLAPGERVPFHCHTTTYFWVCVEAGRADQRYPDGQMETFDFRVGDVDFLDLAPGTNLVHDLDNCGDARLRFIAVELLDGGRSAAA